MNYIAELRELFVFNKKVITFENSCRLRAKTEVYTQELKSYLNRCHPTAEERVINEITREAEEISNTAKLRFEHMMAEGDMSLLPEDPIYTTLAQELQPMLEVCWYDFFIKEYYHCIKAVLLELDKLKAEYISHGPTQLQVKEEALNVTDKANIPQVEEVDPEAFTRYLKFMRGKDKEAGGYFRSEVYPELMKIRGNISNDKEFGAIAHILHENKAGYFKDLPPRLTDWYKVLEKGLGYTIKAKFDSIKESKVRDKIESLKEAHPILENAM